MAGYQFVGEMPYVAKRIAGPAAAQDRPPWIGGPAMTWLGEVLCWEVGSHLMHFTNRGMAPHPPLFADGMTDDDEIRE